MKRVRITDIFAPNKSPMLTTATTIGWTLQHSAFILEPRKISMSPILRRCSGPGFSLLHLWAFLCWVGPLMVVHGPQLTILGLNFGLQLLSPSNVDPLVWHWQPFFLFYGTLGSWNGGFPAHPTHNNFNRPYFHRKALIFKIVFIMGITTDKGPSGWKKI